MPVYPMRGVDISGANATVGNVLAPRTFFSIAPPKKTGTMNTVGLDPALNAYPAGYHAGAASLTAVDTDLIPAAIIYGVQIFGVTGISPGVYDLWALQGKPDILHIPIPTISSPPSVVADASGGGTVLEPPTLPALVTPIPTVALTECANSMLLIDDLETNVWNEFVGAFVTSTLDAVVFKFGAKSEKMDVADLEAVGLLATQAYAPMDLRTYNYIKLWIRSTVACNLADLQFLLDEHPMCVSPLKNVSIPALVANTWTEVTLALGDASGLGAIISLGVNMAVDKGIFVVNIDQIRATKGV
jgi:hypothetical protein